MQYFTPTTIDQNGFNTSSPIVQGMGYQSIPYTYYQQQQVIPPWEQNYQRMIQEDAMNNPQMYQQPQQQQTLQAPDGDYWSNLGASLYDEIHSINEMHNQANQVYSYMDMKSANPFNPAMEQLFQQFSSYPKNYEQEKAQVFDQAYQQGRMPLSQYAFYNNAGFHQYNPNYTEQPFTYGGVSRDWYGVMNNGLTQGAVTRKQIEEHKRIQRENWDICCRINDKFFGIPDTPERRLQCKQFHEFQDGMQAYFNQVAQEEAYQNKLVQFVHSLPNSTQKDYVSPLKADYIHNWNTRYDQRHERYGDYGVDEFFNKGIATLMIFDDMVEDAKKREREKLFQYDRRAFREGLHQIDPRYDPETGTSSKPCKLHVGEIDVKLPESLLRDQYTQRKLKFMDSIFQHMDNILPQ